MQSQQASYWSLDALEYCPMNVTQDTMSFVVPAKVKHMVIWDLFCRSRRMLMTIILLPVWENRTEWSSIFFAPIMGRRKYVLFRTHLGLEVNAPVQKSEFISGQRVPIRLLQVIVFVRGKESEPGRKNLNSPIWMLKFLSMFVTYKVKVF